MVKSVTILYSEFFASKKSKFSHIYMYPRLFISVLEIQTKILRIYIHVTKNKLYYTSLSLKLCAVFRSFQANVQIPPSQIRISNSIANSTDLKIHGLIETEIFGRFWYRRNLEQLIKAENKESTLIRCINEYVSPEHRESRACRNQNQLQAETCWICREERRKLWSKCVDIKEKERQMLFP